LHDEKNTIFILDLMDKRRLFTSSSIAMIRSFFRAQRNPGNGRPNYNLLLNSFKFFSNLKTVNEHYAKLRKKKDDEFLKNIGQEEAK
jgi:hypothetical protein